MRRALHIGIFVGTLIGMSACATIDRVQTAAHVSIEAVRLG
ncbi:hypothetical protein [Brevundimonas variabilis]|uniref:Putative membrane protein n=1 Tax=Brevundimonas variabilis TaxID=74312 RepID=A0A7W9CH61_9CAUL|nr:hypothetical protein [Brevundimonas variabilis]MBB5745565.1 putative membrane protein [Brevundimonas variabilis]